MASGLTTVASANGAALVDWTVKRRTRDDVRVRLARPGGGACDGGDIDDDDGDGDGECGRIWESCGVDEEWTDGKDEGMVAEVG